MAEWKPFDLKWGRSIWYCSACEESTEVPTHLGTPMYNFCPMCGANMNMKKADGCKTENSSEKPNNCEHITEDGVTCAKYPACDDCLDNPLNKVKGSERLVKGSENPNNSTISKMEQVDEPQTPYDNCQSCLHWVHDGYWYCECNECRYEPKDEPQTQLTAKCLNCNNSKACKEKHWDGCVYEPKDEKTCETCRHWKYIAHEWQCEACKCQGYEPKDEPQTETEIAKAIVHKMIDDAVIAEDAYPDLRQKMHDAVDEYEPQTDCAWKNECK